MAFEPLEPELEEALSKLLEGADEDGWSMFRDYVRSPEYRELKRVGMFDQTREYINGDAAVLLSYSARKYFDRKDRANEEKGPSVPNRIASVAGTFLGAAAKEFSSE